MIAENKFYTQYALDEAKEISFRLGYDKGRWDNPSAYEVFEKRYYEQQKLDQSIKKDELKMKIMDIDRISALQKELDEVKDKYIKLLEVMYDK